MTPMLAASETGPLLILVAALLLDAVLPALPGGAALLPSPRRIAAALGRWLTRRLDRARRSERTRQARGAIVAMIAAGAAALAGWAIQRASGRFPYGALLELAVATMLLGQRYLFTAARRVSRALASGAAGQAAARKTVAALQSPGWDVARLDLHGLARGAIEILAVGFAERVVAPAFWYALAGLPGMMVAVSVNAIAERGPEESHFARAMLRLDDLLQYVPARIAALLLAFAAFCAPTARPFAALRAIGREPSKHRVPNRGWPVAAVAGALSLSLAGPRFKADGSGAADRWIGDGRARADSSDINRALFLFAVACLVNAALAAAIAFARAAAQT